MIVYLGFLGLLAILRLVELRLSHKNWKTHETYATRLEETLFPKMVMLHTSFFFILPLELWLRRPTFGGVLSWTAIGLTLAAFALRFWTLRSIGRSWNVRVVYGEDYPIVSHGPYRWIRHPNYLVVILELAFIPLIYHLYVSAALITLLNLPILAVRIRNEEAVLMQNPQWIEQMQPKARFLPGVF